LEECTPFKLAKAFSSSFLFSEVTENIHALFATDGLKEDRVFAIFC
jgi:hypothetical protein